MTPVKPFDHIGVARRPAVVSGAPMRSMISITFCLASALSPQTSTSPNGESTSPRSTAEILCSAPITGASSPIDLLRLLKRRTGRRHKWLNFIERHDGVDDDLTRQLAL